MKTLVAHECAFCGHRHRDVKSWTSGIDGRRLWICRLRPLCEVRRRRQISNTRLQGAVRL